MSNLGYHVFNRGNDRNTLFREAADYRAFTAKMEQTCVKHKVERVAYVLMPNHFHAILMAALGTSYAKRYNLKYSHTGHVFQGRYRYTHIESEEALNTVARYIHLNPVKARLVRKPEDWEYSDFKRWREERKLIRSFRAERGG